MHLKFGQKLKDLLRWKYIKRVLLYKRTHRRYKKKLEQLKNKIRNGQKIRVCFSVVYDSVFQAQSLFEKMLKDDIFEPFILVIPDVFRGEENMFYQMDKTYKTLSSKYDNVYQSYDYDKKCFIDFADKTDIICFVNPYDKMTDNLYTIKHFAKKGIPGFFIQYGYVISNWHYDIVYKNKEYGLIWKIFALEKYEKNKLLERMYNKEPVVLAGYSKMDVLASITKIKRTRKKIIIAPHHTVDMDALSLSTFMQYYDFFLKLPQKYPDIDFVFRPHQLLFVTLSKDNYWGKEKVDEYIKKMTSFPNVEYQNGGPYFDTFVNSDALIHDCGSFSAEYLFTGHPCCFLLKNEEITNKNSNEFHKKCIDQHYKAFNESEIIDFIENVVINGNDTLKNSRQEFFDEVLKNNYPYTTDFVLSYIKKELGYE